MGKVLASDNQSPISGLRISQAFNRGPLTRLLKVSWTLVDLVAGEGTG